MKKFKLDATTIIEDLPDDWDLAIKIAGPNLIHLRVNKGRVFNVLANLDQVLATINGRGRALITQFLFSQAIREDELLGVIKAQDEQGLNVEKKKKKGRRKR